MGTSISFGKFIAAKRKSMRLTQEELAEEVGVSKSAIAKWETGGGLPDRDNLKRLSVKLNTSLGEMHRVIEGTNAGALDLEINITPEIIAALEAHGYRVIGPGEE